MAEADGNRTRLAEMLGHIGVEDRARHQTRYASTGIVGRGAAEHRPAVHRELQRLPRLSS